MTVEDIRRIRAQDPEAVIIVHGEVKPELQRAADEVLSTSQMTKYVDRAPRKEPLRDPDRVRSGGPPRAREPGKAVLQALPRVPVHEGQHLENVYETLRDEPAERRVTVPEATRVGAEKAMLRMIELAAS